MIPKIYFKKSKVREVFNYYWIINHKYTNQSFRDIFPEDFVKKIYGKKLIEVRNIIEDKVEEDYQKLGNKIYPYLRELKFEWSKVEKDYFKRLETIMKKPFLAKKVMVYATLTPICGYKSTLPSPWFKVSVIRPVDRGITTMIHEMLHFMFRWYYWDYCKKHLDEDGAWHLSEALTFILNEEFSDLMKIKDKGYKAHQEIREKLAQIWIKERDFERFLDKSFKIIKSFRIDY